MVRDKSREIVFLGTGSYGGVPGKDKSHRLESSLLIRNGLNILIDVTRDFPKQVKNIDRLDAVFITHGHTDASGGILHLNNFQKSRNKALPIYAHKKTIEAILKRHKNLNYCEFFPCLSKGVVKIGEWKVTALEIPHSFDPSFPAFAWKFENIQKTIVYVSDIASLPPSFKKFCQKSDFLIIDGATWRRKIFTHLRIDTDLPVLCKWNVNKNIFNPDW